MIKSEVKNNCGCIVAMHAVYAIIIIIGTHISRENVIVTHLCEMQIWYYVYGYYIITTH